MKKIGLALGSGATLGIAHLGFLQVMRDNGIKFDMVAGASMGSIIGAMYCADIDFAPLLDTIQKTTMRHIRDFDFRFISNLGLSRTRKAEKMLESILGDKKIENFPIPFACTAIDLISGKFVVLNKGSAARAVMSSSAIPGVFQPISYVKKRKIKGETVETEMLLIDGGTVHKVPVELCRKMGADFVIGIDVMAEIVPIEKPQKISSVIKRSFLIMNHYAGEHERTTADKLIVIQQNDVDPTEPLDALKSYEYGVQAGEKHLDEIKRIIKRLKK